MLPRELEAGDKALLLCLNVDEAGALTRTLYVLGPDKTTHRWIAGGSGTAAEGAAMLHALKARNDEVKFEVAVAVPKALRDELQAELIRRGLGWEPVLSHP